MINVVIKSSWCACLLLVFGYILIQMQSIQGLQANNQDTILFIGDQSEIYEKQNQKLYKISELKNQYRSTIGLVNKRSMPYFNVLNECDLLGEKKPLKEIKYLMTTLIGDSAKDSPQYKTLKRELDICMDKPELHNYIQEKVFTHCLKSAISYGIGCCMCVESHKILIVKHQGAFDFYFNTYELDHINHRYFVNGDPIEDTYNWTPHQIGTYQFEVKYRYIDDQFEIKELCQEYEIIVKA